MPKAASKETKVPCQDAPTGGTELLFCALVAVYRQVIDGIETTGEKNRQSGMVTESATTHQAAWNPVEMVNTLMVRQLRSKGACIGVPVSLSRPALPKSRSRKEYSQHLSIFLYISSLVVT